VIVTVATKINVDFSSNLKDATTAADQESPGKVYSPGPSRIDNNMTSETCSNCGHSKLLHDNALDLCSNPDCVCPFYRYDEARKTSSKFILDKMVTGISP